MTIAISAATGQLGRLALRALAARGGSAIALARDPARAADLGVPVRAFDYTAPDAAVLAGVSTLVLISSNDISDRAGQHRAAIDAARAAGVGHIVYTSILKGPASPLLLAQDHIATEAHLAATGIPHTLLRNGWYTENYTGSLGAALGAGAMIGAAGGARVSAAARADYAEAIAAVLTTPGTLGRAYELAGDTAFTLPELAAEVSRQAGRTIPYNALPEEAYAGILQSFGLPESLARMLADSDAKSAQGALFDDSGTLSRLIGRPTTPAASTVAAALAAL